MRYRYTLMLTGSSGAAKNIRIESERLMQQILIQGDLQIYKIIRNS